MSQDDTPRGLSRRSLGLAALGGVAAVSAAKDAQAQSAKAPILEPTRLESPDETMRPELLGTFGMVAAGRHYAVEAGIRTLLAGGNATDAGVAAVFAASVTEISHFGFGGESPTIIYDAKTAKVSAINGQGCAPMLATPAVFAREGVIPGNGPNGGTVPAMLDAMCLALQLNGTMNLAQVMGPAIELADGFPMYAFLRNVMISQRKATEKYASSKANYYPDGRVVDVGEIFRSPNLARTLRTIVAAEAAALKAKKGRKAAIQAGRDAFYKGDIARRIGAAVEKDGGTMRYEDLAKYRGKVEAPATSTFYGYQICKGGFWSQGPVQLMILNILEAAGVKAMKPYSEEHLHTVAEAFKLAFDDRNAYFGDPDFVSPPTEGLLSKAYAATRAKLIGHKASLEHRYGDPYAFDSKVKRPAGPQFVPHAIEKPTPPTADTTAIEVVDKDGNLFSCTPSSGWLLGGAYVAGDTGVPLSNRMTVFDLDPLSPNVLAPGKRPRTTLSPSMVLKDGKPFLAIGTPGGDNQDQQICNVLLNLLAFEMPLQQAIEAPRINSNHFHNSFGNKRDDPGSLEIENRVPADVRNGLTARGHRLDVLGPWGVSTGVVAVGVVPGKGTLRGAADPRRERYVFGW